jgi:hypothetical protein
MSTQANKLVLISSLSGRHVVRLSGYEYQWANFQHNLTDKYEHTGTMKASALRVMRRARHTADTVAVSSRLFAFVFAITAPCTTNDAVEAFRICQSRSQKSVLVEAATKSSVLSLRMTAATTAAASSDETLTTAALPPTSEVLLGSTTEHFENYDVVRVDLENARDYSIYIGTGYSDEQGM